MPADDNQRARAATFEMALGEASRDLGLNSSGARLLRLHGSGIYLLPKEGMVARLVEATDEDRARASTGVQVTGWLAAQRFPATKPAYDTPVEAAGTVVTFWRYLAQPDGDRSLRARAIALGELLRELHHLPAPPFSLPTVDPLARLRRAVALDAVRPTPALADDECAFLEKRMTAASTAFDALDFLLGPGLIHNDAHIGNLLVAGHSPHGYVLGDWDSAGWGPREVDLVLEGAPGNRFGKSEEVRRAFSRAYGYDIATWSGWRALRDVRDLHSLAAYIRTATTKAAARDELKNRINSIKNGDTTQLWRGIA